MALNHGSELVPYLRKRYVDLSAVMPISETTMPASAYLRALTACVRNPLRPLALSLVVASLAVTPSAQASRHSRSTSVRVISVREGRSSVVLSNVVHVATPRAGDELLSSATLVNSAPQFGLPVGGVIGSVYLAITLTSAQQALVDGIAMLPGGTVSFAGHLTTAESVVTTFAVDSGTGGFANARGTFTLGTGSSAPWVFRLSLPTD